MVKLEKSQKEFLMLLLENENPQSIQSIQDQLDISRRTVYYIVNKINDIFYELRMEPINNKRGHGYYLTADQKRLWIQYYIPIELYKVYLQMKEFII